MPLELQRQFGLMRELDERAYRLQQQVDADMLQQLKLAGQQQQQGVLVGRGVHGWCSWCSGCRAGER